MIEITPVIHEEIRFLGIKMYLPKCTLRCLFNVKLIILDERFDLKQIEQKCPVPLVQCKSCVFEHVFEQKITAFSESAELDGINKEMNVKEAITCIFSEKKQSESLF